MVVKICFPPLWSKCSEANGVREHFPWLRKQQAFSAGDCLLNTLCRGEVVQHFKITIFITHKGAGGILISPCSDGLKSNSSSWHQLLNLLYADYKAKKGEGMIRKCLTWFLNVNENILIPPESIMIWKWTTKLTCNSNPSFHTWKWPWISPQTPVRIHPCHQSVV